MRRASLPPQPSLLPSRDGVALRFGSARGRLPAPRHVRTAADGALAWSLCDLAPGRAALVAWRPRDAALAWRVELAGDARFAVSPDGALLVLCDDRGLRSLLDARSGVTLAETRDDGGLPDALALARADARRALVVRAGRARVIDLDTGALVASLDGAAPAALSPDGRRVALSSARGVVVHDLHDDSSTRHHAPRGARASAVDLAHALAVGFDDGSARVALPRRVVALPAVGGAVVTLRSAPDGALAVGHADGLVRVFAADGGAREAVGGGAVDDIAADLSRALFREARAAPALDLTAHDRHDPRAGHLDAVTAIAIARGTVVTASRDGTLRLWDADSRETLLALEGHAGPVAALALAPDGRGAFTCGARDGLRAWCLASGTERPLPSPAASLVRAARLLASPCGRRLAALTEAEALLVDAATGALVGRAPLGPWGPVAAFDDRGDALFVPISTSADGVVVARLDARHGARLADVTLPLAPRDARRARPCAIVRECNGAIVTAETDRASVTRWSLGDAPEPARHAAGSDLLRAPFVALGGRLLASASGARVDVCELADGARGTFRLPERHDAVTSLAVAPDGRWLVVGTAQGLAQRFDV